MNGHVNVCVTRNAHTRVRYSVCVLQARDLVKKTWAPRERVSAKNSVRDTGKELGNTGENKVKNKRKMNYKEEETVA